MSVSSAPVPRLVTHLSAWSALLNVDFCPRANRWVYWMKHPLWCLVAALAVSIACGILVNPQLLIVTGALTVVVAVGVAWPWLAIRGLTCELAFDQPRSRAGQTTTVRLRVVNRWPWPVWGVRVERGFSRSSHAADGVALARLPGWWRGEFEWPFTPPGRGIYPLQPPVMATAFPFGLWSALRPVDVVKPLIVWPPTVALSGVPDGTEFRPSEQRFSDRRSGDSGDRLGTRPFRDGDAIRRIHWAQTARHRQLIVSELQGPASSVVSVLIDVEDDADPVALEAPPQSLEPMIAVGASICESLFRQHTTVHCRLANRQFTVNDAVGLRDVMDELAHLPANGLPAMHSLRCGGDPPADTLQLVVTSESRRARRGGVGSARHRLVIVPLEPDVTTADSAATHAAAECSALAVLPEEWRRICRG